MEEIPNINIAVGSILKDLVFGGVARRLGEDRIYLFLYVRYNRTTRRHLVEHEG